MMTAATRKRHSAKANHFMRVQNSCVNSLSTAYRVRLSTSHRTALHTSNPCKSLSACPSFYLRLTDNNHTAAACLLRSRQTLRAQTFSLHIRRRRGRKGRGNLVRKDLIAHRFYLLTIHLSTTFVHVYLFI